MLKDSRRSRFGKELQQRSWLWAKALFCLGDNKQTCCVRIECYRRAIDKDWPAQ